MAVVLGWKNLCDTALSLRATLDGVTKNPSAVLTPQLAHSFATGGQTSTASLWRLHVDLGSVVSGLRLFVLALPKAAARPSSPTFMRLFLDTATEGGSNAWFGPDDNATILANGYWAYLHPTDIAARHITWRFTWNALLDPVIETGRVYAGPALVTARGVLPDLMQETLTADVTERAGLAGLRLGQAGTAYRRLDFTAPSLTLAEATSLHQCATEAGTTGQVFCSPFAESRAAMSSAGFFGRFTELPEPQGVPRLGRYSARFRLEEDV